MNSIISNVRDLEAPQRQTLEAVVGHPLHDNEQVIIQVVALDSQDVEPNRGRVIDEESAPALPDWCDVYEGLTDEEIEDLEQAILQRADLSRP
jgi:hypothetical protein